MVAYDGRAFPGDIQMFFEGETGYFPFLLRLNWSFDHFFPFYAVFREFYFFTRYLFLFRVDVRALFRRLRRFSFLFGRFIADFARALGSFRIRFLQDGAGYFPFILRNSRLLYLNFPYHGYFRLIGLGDFCCFASGYFLVRVVLFDLF